MQTVNKLLETASEELEKAKPPQDSHTLEHHIKTAIAVLRAALEAIK